MTLCIHNKDFVTLFCVSLILERFSRAYFNVISDFIKKSVGEILK